MSKVFDTEGDVMYHLGEDDAILVSRENGDVEMALPNSAMDSHVREDSAAWKIMVAMMLINDKDLFEEVASRVKEEHFVHFSEDDEDDESLFEIPKIEKW